ncbi:MAG: chaperonin GroEL [Herpetosiphonaceae bacterium]|nr:chaperonin GroEL [Herpetosiphonaceae bacterium]
MTAGPGLLIGTEAHRALCSGIDRMANLVRPTLGPTPRHVAISPLSSGGMPEVLDDAATILRRVVQLPNPYVDMGAMLLRHTLHRTAEAVAEGTATTAVLMQAIVRHASRAIAAGCDPVAIRHGLESGLLAAVGALQQMARPLEGSTAITNAAGMLCQDRELARLLGEIFDIAGSDGLVYVEAKHTLGLERQYIEGLYWNEGLLSPYFITHVAKQEARLEEPALLLSDLRLTSAEELVPLLEQVVATGATTLLIVADELSGSALNLLVANHQAGILHCAAVKTPSYGQQRAAILEDLAILTGGRAIIAQAGASLNNVGPADLGHARLAWATAKAFGLRGGQGDRLQLRERIKTTKAELAHLTNTAARDDVRARLGKLLGGVAILQVGAVSEGALETAKAQAQRATTALRLALQGGVVPGGGRAFLLCHPAVQHVALAGDACYGRDALLHALAEPLLVIAHNAGYAGPTIVAQVTQAPADCGFDARSGQLVDVWRTGLLDPALVLIAALEAAVSGAVMALTTDVLVHRRQPPEVIEP